MTVRIRPRPPGPGIRERRDRSVLEWLREQQALIEEARRRARRRRQGYAALALLGVAVVVVVGFTGLSGGHQREVPDASVPSVPSGQSAAGASNGKIAIADDLGRLQFVDPDGSRGQVIAHCRAFPCGLAEPAWSPDGSQIAFVWEDPGVPPGVRETFSLYLADSDGGRLRRLTPCGSCGLIWGAHLSWSPDGSWVAFSLAGPGWTLSLWAVNPASGELRRLTDCRPNMCADVSPDWASSGELIAFSRMDERGSSLYTVRPDGSHLTKITDSAFAANPRWSPNGRKIAFDGSGKIFIVDADGSDQKLVVDGTTGSLAGVPSWSPDGTKLAFFNTPGEPGISTAEVWTMSSDGSARQRLYHSPCCVEGWAAPIWSPDGKKIAFAATSADGTFVIGSDGTGLRRLSTASAKGITWQQLR